MTQKHLQLLRNGSAYGSYLLAYNALTGMTSYADGTPILARYSGDTGEIKTLLGVVNNASGEARVDIISDVQASILRDYNLEVTTTGAIETNDSIEVALNKLENQVKSAKAAATTKVEKDAQATHLTLTSSAATDDSVTYTIGESNIASKTDLDAEIKDRKRIEGQNGTAYTQNAMAKYISGATDLNNADVLLDTAVASLSDKVDNLNYNLAKDDNKVVVSLNQTNGKISGTSENITSVKLADYTVGGDDSGKIDATDTLGAALGKLQGQINGMDKAASAVDGQVVTTVAEADGKVTETKANVKDLQLGGYEKDTTATGDIASNDTVNAALSKLENTVTANKIANGDGSINVTTDANGTDINVNIKSGEHVLAKTGGNGLYTDIKLSGVTPSSTTVKEEYSLVATDGTVLGTNIKIYKDSSISKIYLGYPTDTVDSTSGVITSGTTGEAQSLNYVYHKEDGTYEMVHVDVSKFLVESEFASGVTADANGVVHGVVDTNSEKVITSYDENGTSATTGSVLTVGTNGFSVANIQTAIDAKVGTLDYTDTAVAGQYVSEVDETDGKIAVSRANVSEAVLNNYSKGSDATAVAATDTVNQAISKLENQVDKAKAAATTKVVEGTDAGNNMEITSATSETDGSVTYKINLTDVASKAALDAEIAARKAVDGQDGQTYAANSGANYISGVNSLNAADVALDTALKAEETARRNIEGQNGTEYAKNTSTKYISGATSMNEADVLLDTKLAELSGHGVTVITSSNNSISATSGTAADGTTSYDLVTDTEKIQLSGYSATATGTTGAPAVGDTVNQAIAKLYNRGTITSTNSGITVDQSGSATTLTLNVSTDTAAAGTTGATYAQKEDGNAIELRDNGIFVSSNWDCGTYDEPAGN